MGEGLDSKLSGQSCQYAVRFCECASFMKRCEAPVEHKCDYKNPISDNLAMCKRENSAFLKFLKSAQENSR